MDAAVWDLRDEADMTECVLVSAEESEEALGSILPQPCSL